MKPLRVLLLFMLCLHAALAPAQVYPVQVTTQLIPPYSVYLSDYASSGNEKLQVILLQRDLSHAPYSLRLVLTVEWNGQVILRTSNLFKPAPLLVDAGIPTVISGADLAPYLDSRNLDFFHFSREQYERTRALPEGNYRISFTAYDYLRPSVQVSNEGNSFYALFKNEPPLLNMPACGSRIPLRSAGVDADGKLLAAPQQVIFSWFPRNTSSLNSATDTEYEFALYETRPAGRNPNDVVLTTPPIFRITTEQTQYVYGPTEPLLLEGMTYVWRVRAVDKGGIDAFRNQGYSEVCTFTYGGSDPDASLGAVKSVQAEGQTERRARVWWTADGTFDSYRVYFKKPGTQWEWFHEDTKTAEIKLYDLEPDNTYETRVQGRKNGVYGAYSDIVTFRTKPRRVFNCGDVPPPEPTTFSSQPLTDVIPGMVIVAGGMEITLTEIQPLDQPGWYKGVGEVSPAWLVARYKVTFERGFINEDRYYTDGSDIYFVSKEAGALVEQQLAQQRHRKRDRQQAQNREQWRDTEFYFEVLVFDQVVIDTIVQQTDSYLEIVEVNGQTYTDARVPQILASASEEAVIIQDKNGDQWVVQKDKATGKTKIAKVEGGGLVVGSDGKILNNKELRKLDRMILASLKKYKKAIEEYLAANKNVRKGKGGGPSLYEDDVALLVAELPGCLKAHSQEVDAIQYRIDAYEDSTSAAFATFTHRIATTLAQDFSTPQAQDNAPQERVDQEVCTALVEDAAILIRFYEQARPITERGPLKEWIEKVKKIYDFFKSCDQEEWKSYQEEGIVPYCFWRDQKIASQYYYSNRDLAFISGLVDGVYREGEGVLHLPDLVRDLSKFPGKLIYAYTLAYWECAPDHLLANYQEYEYTIEQLAALDKEGGIWSWVKEQWYDYKGKKKALEKYFDDCHEAEQLRDDIEHLYEIISSWEEIGKLYDQVERKVKLYFKELDGTDNINRYKQGRFLVTAASAVLIIGELTRISKIRAILRNLKNATETQWNKFGEELEKLKKGKGAEGVAKGADELVGTYTTTIKWGTKTVEARPFGNGYWGKRFPQSNPRVDAYELKINPNNESYYLPLSEERMVQFENISKEALQDGKLIMEKSSIYHVYDKPPVLRTNILNEAKDQAAVAKKYGLKVEWLVSDEKAVDHLTRFFKEENVEIIVKLFPE